MPVLQAVTIGADLAGPVVLATRVDFLSHSLPP